MIGYKRHYITLKTIQGCANKNDLHLFRISRTKLFNTIFKKFMFYKWMLQNTKGDKPDAMDIYENSNLVTAFL